MLHVFSLQVLAIRRIYAKLGVCALTYSLCAGGHTEAAVTLDLFDDLYPSGASPCEKDSVD